MFLRCPSLCDSARPLSLIKALTSKEKRSLFIYFANPKPNFGAPHLDARGGCLPRTPRYATVLA